MHNWIRYKWINNAAFDEYKWYSRRTLIRAQILKIIWLQYLIYFFWHMIRLWRKFLRNWNACLDDCKLIFIEIPTVLCDRDRERKKSRLTVHKNGSSGFLFFNSFLLKRLIWHWSRFDDDWMAFAFFQLL